MQTTACDQSVTVGHSDTELDDESDNDLEESKDNFEILSSESEDFDMEEDDDDDDGNESHCEQIRDNHVMYVL